MNKLFYCLMSLLLLGMGGCTAHSGLDGNTMYTDTYINIAVTPKNGMTPLRYGQTVVDVETDSNLPARAAVHYAMYGDTGPGPVKRYGHVMFVRLNDDRQYRFTHETFPKHNELELNAVDLNENFTAWNEHIMYEESKGDWFSDILAKNGYNAPALWVGKRWSRMYSQSSRIIIEYREPLPECATLKEKTYAGVFKDASFETPTEECKREVNAVFERADNAFEVKRARQEYVPTGSRPDNLLTKMPFGAMNATRAIGTAITNEPTLSRN